MTFIDNKVDQRVDPTEKENNKARGERHESTREHETGAPRETQRGQQGQQGQ